MKRMHVHVSVENLMESVRFYSTLFGAVPTVEKPDYAKWMLDDPRVNFAISQRGAPVGVDHLGIQVEEEQELQAMQERLTSAELTLVTQEATTCCYAKSDKHWVQDPSGIAWEAYRTMDSAPTFSLPDNPQDGACCAPSTAPVAILPKRKIDRLENT